MGQQLRERCEQYPASTNYFGGKLLKTQYVPQ